MGKNKPEMLIRDTCWKCEGLGYKPWHGTGWLARHTHGRCNVCRGKGYVEEWVPIPDSWELTMGERRVPPMGVLRMRPLDPSAE